MIYKREIETIRAALLFWQEEMCPHEAAVLRSYFQDVDIKPLTAAEIELLRADLATSVRYALFNPTTGGLVSTQLESSPHDLLSGADDKRVATVLLPCMVEPTIGPS